MKVEYDCEWCGKRVSTKRSPSTMKVPPRFCSQACNGASRKGTGNGPRPNRKFACVICGKWCEVYRSPSAQEPVTCSIKCTGVKNTGPGNASYTGGRHIGDHGYARVLHPTHDDADSRGYVYEHRLVMESMIGRKLTAEEVVHHKNHIRDDNRPENLQLFATHSDHIKFHAREKSNVE